MFTEDLIQSFAGNNALLDYLIQQSSKVDYISMGFMPEVCVQN